MTCSRHYLAFQPEDEDIVKRELVPGLQGLLPREDRDDFLLPLSRPSIKNPDDDDEINRCILGLMGEACRHFEDKFGEAPEVNVLVSTGFPSMQTAWVMLCAAGTIHADLWRQMPKQHAPKAEPRDLIRRVPTTPPVGAGPTPEISGGVLDFTLAPEDRDALTDYVQSTTPVLLTGPPGCGKTTLSERIHKLSGRAGQFRKFTFAAQPADMIRDELVGHVKSAFTGAAGARDGLFKVCNGGTLLIDEIHQAGPEAQNLLLEHLSEPDRPIEYRAQGDDATQEADIRFIFASNVDLEELVRQGRFRHDLLERIAMGLQVDLRPLDLASIDNISLKRLLRNIWDHLAAGRTGTACPRFTEAALALIRNAGFHSPRALHAFCGSIMHSKMLGRLGHIDAEHAAWAIKHVQAPLRGEADQDDAEDPWASALRGLLSVNDKDGLLREIHQRFSALKPDYRNELERRLKESRFKAVLQHLKAHDVPASAKRLGEHLRRAGHMR